MAKEKTVTPANHSFIPAVSRTLETAEFKDLTRRYGRELVVTELRNILADYRLAITKGVKPDLSINSIATTAEMNISLATEVSFRQVYNLSGTVLHTNLGRAPLPKEAIDAVANVAKNASNIEFNLENGKRGDRDLPIEKLLCRLTGAEAATVVNNNAAAVMLVLNTIALKKEVPVSRGELVEIGGSFRIPDIIARSGAKLVEVGTTNRTRLHDFAQAITQKTGALMAVHTSNYVITGFTESVSKQSQADLAQKHDLPFIVDLGAGALVDLTRFGLPYEPTVTSTLKAGATIVTFSGDKLLGGPQAGLIVGQNEIIKQIKRNPMKRAMRCDKMTIAALAAVLKLYNDPDKLKYSLPTLRLLTRSTVDIAEQAERLRSCVAHFSGGDFVVSRNKTYSQIGSGSLPVETIESWALVIKRPTGKKGGKAIQRLHDRFRNLPIPVIGRIHDDSIWLDMRCLEDESEFIKQLKRK